MRMHQKTCRHRNHGGSERRLEGHHITSVRCFREASSAELSDAHREGNFVLLYRQCHVRAEHGLIGFEAGIAHTH